MQANPYVSPERSSQISAATATILRQSRPAIMFLCGVAMLFALFRIGQIVYTVLQFPLVRIYYTESSLGLWYLGCQLAFFFLEAVLYVAVCRSLVRYLKHVRAVQLRGRVSFRGTFILLNSLWNNLALLAAAVMMSWLGSFVYRTWTALRY